jgi:nucleotide-sensitive chloride channel 1A
MPATTAITALPPFVSREEHRAIVGSTPASFNDIPPKLCHEEHNVSVSLDPPLDSLTVEDAAQGTLYVIERYISFHLISFYL